MKNVDLKQEANNANTLLVAVAEEYIAWRDKLHKEMRGGKMMFDVPKHHKWLDEDELFIYYMDVGRYCN